MPVKRINVVGLDEARHAFDVTEHANARWAAIREITKRSKTTAVRAITDRYTIAQRRVRPTLLLNIKNGPPRIAEIQTTRADRRRENFAVSYFRNPTWKRTFAGAKVTIIKGGGRKTIVHAFIRTMTSGHVGVFLRSKNRISPKTGRAAITELTSSGPAGMFDQDRVYTAIAGRIDSDFKTILEREISRRLA